MPEHEEAPPAVSDPRVSTGCAPLDQMLSGGLVPRRPYLVVGPSGTGKTTLALQFLCEGIRRGERCLVVTLEEPPNEIRTNHRNLAPELDEVYVFDAIPDVMRYERAPFKDIAAVRQSVPFKEIPFSIRKSPELASVEVTFTALEQTLKMEMARRSYSRMVIDSLTALQYFCMKGFDETLGAQTFLRFLSDLHVTTLLTVEAPLEDVESPERLLARGEVRLFRWELDSRTVRAIGVEKFRGSPHDNTLHPYRISPRGLDINLDVTISRDTRTITPTTGEVFEPAAAPATVEEFSTGLAALGQDSRDLTDLSADVSSVRAALLDALVAARAGDAIEVARAVVRARGRALEIAEQLPGPEGSAAESPSIRRLRARASAARTGIPPFSVPDPAAALPALESILKTLEVLPPPAATTSVPRPSSPPPPEVAPPISPEVGAPSVSAPPAAIEAAATATEQPTPAPPAPAPPPAQVPAPPTDAPRPHVPFPPAAPLEPRPTPVTMRPPPAPPAPPLGSEPPPLPNAVPGTGPVSGTTPRAAPAPASRKSAVPTPRASSPRGPSPPPLPVAGRSVVPPTLPIGPGSAEAGPSAGADAQPMVEAAAPKKRKRISPVTAPKKRTPRTPKAPSETAPPGPDAPVAAASSPDIPPAADAAAPVKKRRAPRKKAAVPVVGPGTPAPEAEPAASAPEPPPTASSSANAADSPPPEA